MPIPRDTARRLTPSEIEALGLPPPMDLSAPNPLPLSPDPNAIPQDARMSAVRLSGPQTMEAILGIKPKGPEMPPNYKGMLDPETANIENTMGTAFHERATIKNFLDLDTSRAYLLAIKDENGKPFYEVADSPKSFGANQNFFVRRAGSADPWRPMDPSPSNPWDYLLDISDLTYDAVQAILIGTATASGALRGGPSGAALGAEVTYAATEAARYKIGNSLISGTGVHQDINPPAIGLGMALSGATALAPPIGRVMGRMISGAPGAVQAGAAAVSGTRGLASFASPGQVLTEAALEGGIGGLSATGMKGRLPVRMSNGSIVNVPYASVDAKLPTMYVSAKNVWQTIKSFDDTMLPANAQAHSMAAQYRGTVDITQELEALRRFLPVEVGVKQVDKTRRIITDVFGNTSERTAGESAIYSDVARTPITMQQGIPTQGATRRSMGLVESETRSRGSKLVQRGADLTTTKTTFEPEFAPIDDVRPFVALHEGIVGEVQKALRSVRTILGDTPETSVSMDQLLQIKRILQKIGYGVAGEHTTAGNTTKATVTRKVFREVASLFRTKSEDVMESAGMPEFRDVMATWERQLRALEDIESVYGANLPEAKGVKKAEMAIRTIFKGDAEAAYRTLVNSERVLELPDGALTGWVWKANVGRAVASKGGWIPRLSRYGVPGGSVALGAWTGNPLLMAAGGAAALGSTPRALSAGARTAAKAAPFMQRTGAMTKGAADVFEALAPVTMPATSIAVSEDQRKKGRLDLTKMGY